MEAERKPDVVQIQRMEYRLDGLLVLVRLLAQVSPILLWWLVVLRLVPLDWLTGLSMAVFALAAAIVTPIGARSRTG